MVLLSSSQELNRECASSYKELNQRIQRSRELRRIAQKMKTQKDLMVGHWGLRLASSPLSSFWIALQYVTNYMLASNKASCMLNWSKTQQWEGPVNCCEWGNAQCRQACILSLLVQAKEKCTRIPGDGVTPSTYKWRQERKKWTVTFPPKLHHHYIIIIQFSKRFSIRNIQYTTKWQNWAWGS